MNKIVSMADFIVKA